MGKDNTLLFLAIGGVAAYFLMPEKIREKITPGGGGGGVTSLDFTDMLGGLGGGTTTIIERIVETIRELPSEIPQVPEVLPDVSEVLPDIGFPGYKEFLADLIGYLNPDNIPRVPGAGDIFDTIKETAGDVFTTTKKPPGPPKYNIGDYLGAAGAWWYDFITGWQEPKEQTPPVKVSEYALSVLKGQLEREGQQRWDDMTLAEKAGFIFTGRWPEWTPKSEPTPYPDSFLKGPEPAPITEKAPGLTSQKAQELYAWAHAYKSEPTPTPEPAPSPEPTPTPEPHPWSYT